MHTTKGLWRRALPVAAAIIVFAVWRYERLSQAAADVSASASGRTMTAIPSLPSSSPSSWPFYAAATPSVAGPGPLERAIDVPALREALAGRPDAESEVHRVVAFARFRDRVAEYGNGKNRLSAVDRMRLARQILAELPEHVARNEIVPVQAQAMTAALLIDAEPDPIARSADLAAASRQWNAYAKQTVGPSPAQDPRYQVYAQRSRAIFQEVQATISEPAQQQAVIAQRLQALRIQLFDHASSPGTH